MLIAKNIIKWTLIGLFIWFFLLMCRITLFYVPFSATVSFLNIKQTEVTTLHFYLPIFYTHVYSSIFVLLAGFIQFFTTRKKHKTIHQYSGYIYVIGLLLFSAPSGIYMGLHANGGFWAQLSFIILGCLWWFTTFMAMVNIFQKDIKSHQQWMNRSYALAVSALTLRMWKVILVYLFQPNPMEVYLVIAWLGWVPNLLIIELLILKKYKYEKARYFRSLALPVFVQKGS
ncbi:DUF2306 domain-containing protein [Elizabethkingia anophelis]|uniref:DUF2306 domain-containing protein n=1 Tax=Elizabethkingia anophelis TaxID=1117645 RepID=UPI00259B9166|nr:DUF2306 domain-containing protein [Elizabethkingia anophelis]WJK01935.1 DUF2306 domain-containing protein [Elizabethkingia anophelis]